MTVHHGHRARTILNIDPDALELLPLDLDPAAFQSALPLQHYHPIFEDDDIGLAVGVWDTTPMQEAFGPYPGDEFITVLDGQFAIVDANGAAVVGGQGQSATFRNAIPVSWKQEGYLRKVYLTLQMPAAETPAIASATGGVRVINAGRTIATPPGADGVARDILFRNDAGTMTVTHCIWPAMTLPAGLAPAHELCRVLAGEITLTEPGGHMHAFGPGSHFFVPREVACIRATRAGTSALHVIVTAEPDAQRPAP